MTNRLTFNKLIIHLVLVSIIAGCTTMQPVYGTDARSLARQIQVGDKIKIIRNDESDVTFNVGAASMLFISSQAGCNSFKEVCNE